MKHILYVLGSMIGAAVVTYVTLLIVPNTIAGLPSTTVVMNVYMVAGALFVLFKLLRQRHKDLKKKSGKDNHPKESPAQQSTTDNDEYIDHRINQS